MKELEVLKKWKTSKIIKKIKKGKLNINIEELLVFAINSNRNDLVTYILENLEYAKDYTNDFNHDYLSAAVSRGNIDIIKTLQENNFDIQKKYKYGRKIVSVVYYIRDLETLKHLEKHIDKKQIKKDLENVIRTTITRNDIELLDYIISNYKINLKKIKYSIQNKKYNILELTEEILQSMKNREFRKKEFAYYISDLLPDGKYKKIKKRAYDILKKAEEENEEIEKYYKYLKKQFGVKK